MVVAGPRLFLLILLILGASLLLVPSTSAQQACDEDLMLPTCVEPEVQVEMPGTVDARRDTGIWADDGSASLRFPVNVTITSDLAPPDEEVTVTVETEPIHGLEAVGGSEVVTPGETVSVQVRLDLTLAVPAGANLLKVHVNTTGTNVYAPTQQTAEGDLLMFWWFERTLTEVPHIGFLEEGSQYTFRVNNMTANGPFDILLTSPSHVPEPRILEMRSGLSPDDPVTREWTVLFHGPTDYAEWQMWPVVSTEEGLSCPVVETGELMELGSSLEDLGELTGLAEDCHRIGGSGGSSDTGRQIGGFAGLVFLISNGLVLLGMIGAVFLGGFVLHRGGRKLPARALGVYLIMAGVGFGSMTLDWITIELIGWTIASILPSLLVWSLIGGALVLLPTALLFFALGYPTRHPRLRNMKLWFLLPFAPWLAFSPVLGYIIFAGHGDLAFTLVFAYNLLGAVLSAVLFKQRAGQAKTTLERQRLLFMFRFVVLPLMFGSVLTLLGANLDVHVFDGAIWEAGIAGILIAPVALGPVIGMAWGLLRYKIVDLDKKVRLTVSRGFIGAVFIAVFFLVAEVVKTYFSENLGPYIGLVAAALLIPALVPLQRVGRRLATRVVPEPPDPEAYQSFRRLEIYRAAYEEVAVDDQITDKERRAMDSLARTLKLSPDEITFVETEVSKEREALTLSPQSPAASGV